MGKLGSLWLVSVMFLLLSCSLSASSDKSYEAGTSSNGEIVTLTKAEFLEKVFNYEENAANWVYEGDKPCIVDFYADRCGPCKMVAPILRDLAILYKNDIVVYKINVDEEQELAAAFGIQSIPTFLFIPQEGDPMMAKGALSREIFVEQIDKYLLNKK